jgi:hypothetical protein
MLSHWFARARRSWQAEENDCAAGVKAEQASDLRVFTLS